MKKLISAGLFILSLWLLAGCASNPNLYNYNNYSKRLYRMHKLQTEEAVAEYEAELLAIIESAEGHSKKVPPGIFVEYGYIQAQHGNMSVALDYFSREEALYPESRPFIEFLRQELEKAN